MFPARRLVPIAVLTAWTLAAACQQASSTNAAALDKKQEMRRDGPAELKTLQAGALAATAPARAAADAIAGRNEGVAGVGDGDLKTGGEARLTPSMIIRTGQASIEVDSVDIAITRVRMLAARVGGFVANTAVQGGRDQLRSASLEIRLPAERFDDALGGLTPLGKVESVNVQAEDVGEEYVDIDARVTNAHKLEERLIALLATRTGKLSDVLQVERELARVREEIERYEGRLRYLRTRSAVSTLTLNLHEPLPIITNRPNPGVIGNAFREAWRRFVALIARMIEMSGVMVPLLVLLGLAWAIWRRVRPARRGRGNGGGGGDGGADAGDAPADAGARRAA